MRALPVESPPGWITRWNQISRRLRKQLSDRYTDAGLSESRASVLAALDGPTRHATQADLAAVLLISESNLCGLVERMRVEGLIERDRSPLDRRKTVLTLTSLGRTRCEVVRQIHEEFEQSLRIALPRPELSLDQASLNGLSVALTSLEAVRPESGSQERSAA
ncbi:MarR family winged helix-turn-helix transcriptional regulator [Planctomicrobium piriforme]|uniref:DNA-binding transcriptional regulator, MarR family n=1 Tax=Planctomicrobium piriforme TaxID=1576369 RepID=A0A1I3F266_9PLAN|nr:MarR family winged helix-turn-helix transcriptional regulator [Planctomicrobium piriforme]SFI05336.1 DNA-binding transcriptional regulator, MarR family [Planctomicrobium piriforme]